MTFMKLQAKRDLKNLYTLDLHIRFLGASPPHLRMGWFCYSKSGIQDLRTVKNLLNLASMKYNYTTNTASLRESRACVY